MERFKKTASTPLLAGIFFCVAIFLIPSCLSSQEALPENPEPVSLLKTLGWSDFDSGRLLYVSCPVRAAIRLDDVPVGYAPLLLELSTGEHLLEIIDRNAVDRRRLIVSPHITGLSRLEAVLSPYRGLLNLSCNVEGAGIEIDGLFRGKAAIGALELSEGSHSVKITAEGKVAFEKEVLVPRDGELSLNARLEPGFPLRFDSPIPPGTIVHVLDATGSIVKAFDVREPVLLAAGLTRFRLFPPSGGTLDFSWDPGSPSPVKVSLECRLVLGILPEGTIIEVDGKVLSMDKAGMDIMLQSGIHTLTVRRMGYIPNTLWCDLQPGEVFSPSLVFIQDPLILAQQRKSRGLPFFLSGATMALGGLVFNSDDVAISFSSDFPGSALLSLSFKFRNIQWEPLLISC
jgi:hypothetical protein